MANAIGFMDESGEYSDLREFKDIEISKRTQIDTVAKAADSTVLNVDSDGDGKYDIRYKAKPNSVAEIIDYTYIYYIAAGAGILIFVLVLYIKINKWRKKRIEMNRIKLVSEKKFCTHCGAEMSGEKRFCTKCGSIIE